MIKIRSVTHYLCGRSKQDWSHITYGVRKGPVKKSTFNHFGTVETFGPLLQEIIVLRIWFSDIETCDHKTRQQYLNTAEHLKDAVTLSYSRLVALFGYYSANLNRRTVAVKPC